MRNLIPALVLVTILAPGCTRKTAETVSSSTSPAGTSPVTATTASAASTTTNAHPPEAPSLHGRNITVASKGESTGAYLSLPTETGGNAKHPAIIIIHEWWGLDDWIRENADHLAALGYVALAVDLYHGKSTHDPDVAHQLMRGVPDDRALRDMKDAFDLLAGRGDVDPRRIAVIGWCMGGGYALQLELGEPRLAACVINYGHLVTEPSSIEKVKGPVMGNFGGKDQGITPDDVKAFQNALAAAKVKNDIKIYENSGHGFMNPANTAGYNAADARDAWGRIETFLATTLTPEQ